ncbi:MAG: DNA replication/repair protein RecF [Magnetococcales bacterium]|nr:DNA replication/repair protein RecF [Magnetococcales bacterium]
MFLESLQIFDFRNIAAAELEFGPGLNLIVGPNGQGKSNLLEAVGLLATGRSFRRAPPEALRRHDRPCFRLDGRCQAGGLAHRLEFQGQAKRQMARLNGKPMTTASAMGQALAAVIVTPESLALVRQGPQERRAYMDWVIFSRRRDHAALVRHYRQAMKSRNLLLRAQTRNQAELAAWEDRLADLGGRISWARRRMLERLGQGLIPYLQPLAVTGSLLESRLGSQLDRLDPQWQGAARAAELYRTQLAVHREQDRLSGTTTIGPHRDDLLFRLDGRPLARFGSQGQQKRLVLALKLAEADLLRETLGEAPLFLLDDPAAELDREGTTLFMDLLAERGGQLFVTTCDAGEIPWPHGHRITFMVHAGTFKIQMESNRS